jgi:hypothetical protein
VCATARAESGETRERAEQKRERHEDEETGDTGAGLDDAEHRPKVLLDGIRKENDCEDQECDLESAGDVIRSRRHGIGNDEAALVAAPATISDPMCS